MAEIRVLSEVPGKVWAIEAKVGDKVAEDDAIIILESMKMEIPVSSPTSGTITAILVSKEDAVDEGDHVATIET